MSRRGGSGCRCPRRSRPEPGRCASGSSSRQQESREIVADVELADVKAKLADDLPGIELAHLSGRVGTRQSGAQREVFARALAFTTMTGERLDPVQFNVTLRGRRGRSPGIGRARIRPAAARAARCAGGPSAAAGPDSRRPRPFRAARNADARSLALGGARRLAAVLRGGGGVRATGPHRAGRLSRGERSHRPVRCHAGGRRAQDRQRERHAGSAAHPARPSRVRHAARASCNGSAAKAGRRSAWSGSKSPTPTSRAT